MKKTKKTMNNTKCYKMSKKLLCVPMCCMCVHWGYACKLSKTKTKKRIKEKHQNLRMSRKIKKIKNGKRK